MATMADQVRLAVQEAAGNIQTQNYDFPYQSFFDTTQLGQAIAVQPQNASIVPSTRADVSSSGFGIGLHPDSQTPVAVKFKAGAGVADSQTMVVSPGQIVYPHGCAPFTGFTVGLPFGWLGGGKAQLIILKTPEAMEWWAPGSEVVIQRQRVIIQADGAAPAFSYGLPIGFPWKNAKRYNAASPTTPFDQSGSAVIAAIPTRTEMKLRLTTLAADALVLVLVKNSTVFDTSSGTLVPLVAPTLSGEVEVVPVLFPAIVGSYAYYPTAGFTRPVTGAQLAAAGQGSLSPGVDLAGDDATFCILNESGNAALTGAYVDIVRYGII